MSFLPLEFGPKSRELRQSFLYAYIRTIKAWLLLMGGHVLSGRWWNKGRWSVVRRKKPIEWVEKSRVLTGVQTPESCFPKTKAQSTPVLGFHDTPSVLVVKFLVEIYFSWFDLFEQNNLNENRSYKLFSPTFFPLLISLVYLYVSNIYNRENKNSNILADQQVEF